MKTLDRKLLRDLGRLKGQIVTISLVVAAGLGGLIGMYSTLRSLDEAADTYYERYRFAEVFAHADKVPDAVGRRIASMSGVRTSYTRVVESVRVPMESMVEPALGRVVSLPEAGRPPLNDVFVRRGRLPESDRTDEVLVLESFAEAHALEPGDRLPVVMGGTLKHLKMVGTAMSPEFILVRTGTEIVPDPKRSTVLWMRRGAAAAAFDMEGAFNDVVVSLQRGASEEAVVDALDRRLADYGGLGAYGRDRHPSHAFVTQEKLQLQSTGVFIPMAFLVIAAFLLNVVLSRLVQLQRSEIATLKAVGYADWEIGTHFFKFVAVIMVIGTGIGAAFGAWLGQVTTGQYAQFFEFPAFDFLFDLRVMVVGTAVSLLAGTVGGLGTVLRVVRMPPAEAMRPPAPPVYRATWLERAGVYRWLSAAARMVLRELERRPMRFVLSWVGITMSVALLVTGRFGFDSVSRLLELQFSIAQREDLSVTYVGPVSRESERELESLPGVFRVESQRTVPVRMSAGHRQRETALVGMPADGRMRQIVGTDGRPVQPTSSGLTMSAMLGEVLAVEAGDTVVVEVLEAERRRYRLRVEALVDDVFGMQAYLHLQRLNALLGQPGTVTDALLEVDARRRDQVYRRLRGRPGVLAVDRRARVLEYFDERLSETFLFTNLVMMIVAAVMSVGVIYNNARVALSTRGRDLASLRVLGFTRREVAGILLGEQALQVLLAIPVGWWLGARLSELMMSTVDPETYRFPITISTQSYAFAAVVTVAAAIFSGWLVRRRLDRLDLTEALKTRE